MGLKIKICGMTDEKNIRELAELPIDYMGFIFYSKSPRAVENLPDVKLPSSIQKVGVFVDERLEVIQKKIQQGLQIVQLHGSEAPELCAQLQESSTPVIKAFGIQENFDWTKLSSYTSSVDYFLFDTGSKQHGGTGKTFDWQILQKYDLSTPYFLSGGLSIENIKSASLIKDDRLVGLDLNSRFEVRPGHKNIYEIKNALNLLTNE